MLVNPGGPGASGLNLACSARTCPKHAGDTYDWIGFDPRGVGVQQAGAVVRTRATSGQPPRRTSRSTDALRADVAGPVRRLRQRACGKNGRDAAAAHQDARQRADMDAIRAALGRAEAQLLRLLLRHLPRPGLRDAVPLARAPDGARQQRRPARASGTRRNLDQDTAFELVMGAWFGWLAKYDSDLPARHHRGRGAPAVLRARRRRCRGIPPAGGRARRVGRRVPARRLLRSRPGRASATAFASWVHQHDATQLDRGLRGHRHPG